MGICTNANFTTEKKVKRKSLLSSYYRLIVQVQEQILHVLRLRRENLCMAVLRRCYTVKCFVQLVSQCFGDIEAATALARRF